jgi:drug/metabolite transporter (DMT)-like permease
MRRLLALMGGFSFFVGLPFVQGFCLPRMFRKEDRSSPTTGTMSFPFRRQQLVPRVPVRVVVLHRAIPTTLKDNDDYDKRLAVLASVPIAWGSFEVAVRFAYAATDPPVPPLLFSVAYYAVATAALWLPALMLTKDIVEKNTPYEADVDGKEERDDSWKTAGRGGVELGSYLFIGNMLQVIGLQTIPSDRAAFLLQLTTLFVPIAQSLSERTLPPNRIWIASVIALVGVGFMTLDGDMGGGINSLQWKLGDTLVICAAVSYTFHCLRLETFAQKTKPLRLAASKALTELSLSALLTILAILAFGHEDAGFLGRSGEACITFLSTLDPSQKSIQPLAVATIWTGLAPVSYTIYAQSYGQAKVRPVTANLIYTSQPIWTAVFAYSILGERLAATGYIGGALIGASVLLAVLPQDKESAS